MRILKLALAWVALGIYVIAGATLLIYVLGKGIEPFLMFLLVASLWVLGLDRVLRLVSRASASLS